MDAEEFNARMEAAANDPEAQIDLASRSLCNALGIDPAEIGPTGRSWIAMARDCTKVPVDMMQHLNDETVPIGMRLQGAVALQVMLDSYLERNAALLPEPIRYELAVRRGK